MRRSSGMDGRVSLYAANFASRKLGPGGSHATTKYSGVSSRRSFQTMVDVPSIDVARQPLRGREIGQRVVGAVHVARGVEDEQALGHGDSRL